MPQEIVNNRNVVSTIDYEQPIDITAVIVAVREHRDLLITLDAMSVFDILKHFSPMPGVKDSITLGRTSLGETAHKYTGKFTGVVSNGKIVPRTLVVHPFVMEMQDEPERYRRSYISEVAGGLDPNKHPFEIWLNNYGVKSAMAQLHDVMLTAVYDPDTEKTSIATSFDGPLTILKKEKAAGNLTVALGNVIETGTMTRSNIGRKLLQMWRKMPQTFRRQKSKMFISVDLGDLYDDWLEDQGVLVTGSGAEVVDEQFLRGTGKKVELVRLTGMPEGSQLVILSLQDNIKYGFDKLSDFQQLKPFPSGNPYLYTAAGKAVIGFQFVSLDKSIMAINDAAIIPAEDDDEEETAQQGGQSGTQQESQQQPEQVSTPTFSPAVWGEGETQVVELSCDTAGASIYYTTDGSTPTSESTAYDSTEKITLSATTTIKAIAVKDEMTASEVAEKTYTKG